MKTSYFFTKVTFGLSKWQSPTISSLNRNVYYYFTTILQLQKYVKSIYDTEYSDTTVMVLTQEIH